MNSIKKYGLKKIAELHPTIDVVLRDKMGSTYKMSQLPLSDKVKIEKIAKMRGVGYIGKTDARIGGSLKDLRIEIRRKKEDNKKMLYKETEKQNGLSKDAGTAKTVFNGGARYMGKRKPKTKKSFWSQDVSKLNIIPGGLAAVGAVAALN